MQQIIIMITEADSQSIQAIWERGTNDNK
jgi:hypothetical protein